MVACLEERQVTAWRKDKSLRFAAVALLLLCVCAAGVLCHLLLS
mgnify:CR=1 FL=1